MVSSLTNVEIPNFIATSRLRLLRRSDTADAKGIPRETSLIHPIRELIRRRECGVYFA
jgi:hypothetical protein